MSLTRPAATSARPASSQSRNAARMTSLIVAGPDGALDHDSRHFRGLREVRGSARFRTGNGRLLYYPEECRHLIAPSRPAEQLVQVEMKTTEVGHKAY